MQVNHNLDVAHGLRRRDLEDASGKERKGRRERRRETERERGGRRDQYGELVKSNAPALRPPVRELARRRCVRRFNIDTVDNAPLFFLSFPTFLFLPISSSFFLISRKLAERTNLTPAPAFGEGRSNADPLRFFAQNHCRYHHRCRVDPFVFSGKQRVERTIRNDDRSEIEEEREREKRKGRGPLSLSSECHDCSVCYNFWTNVDRLGRNWRAIF